MFNYQKNINRNLYIIMMLIIGQLYSYSYAKNYINKSTNLLKKENLLKKNNQGSNLFISQETSADRESLIEEAIRLNPYIKEVIEGENLDYSENDEDNKLIKSPSNTKRTFKNKISNSKEKNQKKFNLNKRKFQRYKVSDDLPSTPSAGNISVGEFKIPARGYIKLKGPNITLNFEKVNAIDALKLISKIGGYAIIFVEENSTNDQNNDNSKITAEFNDRKISDVFNSILMSANLQAKVEKNIIFVGENILNKSLMPRLSKTYRLNQVNAGSVGDYLETLGAQISKVLVLSGSADGQEVGDTLVNKREYKNNNFESYGIEGGPLDGLIGTVDIRLQTITLIGSKDLIKTAEKYIKTMDVRHRQVALTIKIIDVALTKTDIKNNIFEFMTGDTYFINNAGLSLLTSNKPGGYLPSDSSNVPNRVTGGIPEGNFMNWLEAKITNESAKILASPTLILGENTRPMSAGAAAVDDSLSAATIGRPFGNEGFIKVGETVITKFNATTSEGVTTCTAEEGTAGITFGAKVDKIDDNGYVTFALSPAISSVTKTLEITGCGVQNTLSVRKLDTGSIRVKDGNTLILTGVLKDEDNVTTSKVPILGDIPLLGSLFRNNSMVKRKSELIILVTPKILSDD